MSMPADTELSEMPSLSKLYVNAAATAARQRLLRATPVVALPARAVEVRGVSADLAKLTAFAHLMGKPARDVLPSGYIHALAFPVAMSVMVQEDFPLPLLGMIHLRNQVQHFAQIHFTDVLRIRSWARDLAGHRSGTQVQLVVEVCTDDGTDVLWRGVSTYLAKGVFLPGLDKPATPSAPGERPVFSPPPPTAQWQLGVDTGRAYAAVSGDFNPIHLSVLSAKALGLRRSIAHGMYAAARVVGDIGSPKPVGFSWDISFDSPIFLPATVSLHIADSLADDGAWLGSEFTAWNARSTRAYFHGSVTAGAGAA
ncbi:dehydratase [Arthrobacter sp. ERGS1:01]|uniref:MaoC/PaaZ C-terminal domain-containing protein n=1 Tax=Arthrobacter sp. ERGS1:01 TaxID=1704044 RepID=UPI0006B54CB2|nr:MaoC/PaaZ C-terminal domain-containing protein [Arthrobacter sp. ERGS1:01]ALE05975.1 dehydratase [Arthrobacter sp. ERGS1:01]